MSEKELKHQKSCTKVGFALKKIVAVCHLKLGELDPALHAINEALKLKPTNNLRMVVKPHTR